jgi:flagellar assembly protein FliH
MSTIIRAADFHGHMPGVPFNFDDITMRADQHLNKIRTEAAKIVLKAQQEADAIRRRAENEGRQAAAQAIQDSVKKQLSTVIPALKQAVQNIHDARHAWLSQWESGAVHLAAAIAKRVIRRELKEQPEITLSLVREALELSAGTSELRILLNPSDLKAMGEQVQMVINEMSPLIKVELTSDPAISAGGCRVETRFGSLDQQFDAQLQRIEEELKQ